MSTLGPDTKVTIGAALAVAVAIGGGAWRIESALASSREEQAKTRIEMSGRLDILDFRLRSLEDHGNGSLKAATFRAWASDLERKNPTLIVPSVQ